MTEDYNCKLCGAQYEDEDELNVHKREDHSEFTEMYGKEEGRQVGSQWVKDHDHDFDNGSMMSDGFTFRQTCTDPECDAVKDQDVLMESHAKEQEDLGWSDDQGDFTDKPKAGKYDDRPEVEGEPVSIVGEIDQQEDKPTQSHDDWKEDLDSMRDQYSTEEVLKRATEDEEADQRDMANDLNKPYNLVPKIPEPWEYGGADYKREGDPDGDKAEEDESADSVLRKVDALSESYRFMSRDKRASLFESLKFSQGESAILAGLEWNELTRPIKVEASESYAKELTEEEEKLEKYSRVNDEDEDEDKAYESLYNLEKYHTSPDFKKKSLTCNRCNESFYNINDRAIHFNEVHATGQEYELPDQCPFCKELIEEPDTLDWHMQERHGAHVPSQFTQTGVQGAMADTDFDSLESYKISTEGQGGTYGRSDFMLNPQHEDITTCVICGRDIDSHSNPNTDYRGMRGDAPSTDHYFLGGDQGGSDESHKATEEFDTDWACPKCGNKNVKTKYDEDGLPVGRECPKCGLGKESYAGEAVPTEDEWGNINPATYEDKDVEEARWKAGAFRSEMGLYDYYPSEAEIEKKLIEDGVNPEVAKKAVYEAYAKENELDLCPICQDGMKCKNLMSHAPNWNTKNNWSTNGIEPPNANESYAKEESIYGSVIDDHFDEQYVMDQDGMYKCKHCGAWLDVHNIAGFTPEEVAKHHLETEHGITESHAKEAKIPSGDLYQYGSKVGTIRDYNPKQHEGYVTLDGIGIEEFGAMTSDFEVRVNGERVPNKWDGKHDYNLDLFGESRATPGFDTNCTDGEPHEPPAGISSTNLGDTTCVKCGKTIGQTGEGSGYWFTPEDHIEWDRVINNIDEYGNVIRESYTKESSSASDLRKEIRKQKEFINMASFENPMNMGDAEDKLHNLESELESLGGEELEGTEGEGGHQDLEDTTEYPDDPEEDDNKVKKKKKSTEAEYVDDSDNAGEKYICEDCDKEFSNDTALQEHQFSYYHGDYREDSDGEPLSPRNVMGGM